MADILKGTISAKKAPAGTVAFNAQGQSFDIQLEALPTSEQASDNYVTSPTSGEAVYRPAKAGAEFDVLVKQGYFDRVNPEASAMYASPTVSKVKPAYEGAKKVICWDLECTGTELYGSRIILGSFWDLSKPKTTMVTFYDEDEETMVAEMLDYLNMEMPDIMTGYNTPYDIRFLSSRAVLYQLPAKGLLNATHHEEMDFWGKGIEQSGLKDQGAGTLEDVALFLFNEMKPYSIEACFGAYVNGDIMPFYVRNRWDVATEGDIYRLTNYVKRISDVDEDIASIADIIDQPRPMEGTINIRCPQCLQEQVYVYGKADQHCYICDLPLPEPTEKMIVKTGSIVNLEESQAQHEQYGGSASALEKMKMAIDKENATLESAGQSYKTGKPPAKASTTNKKTTTSAGKKTTNAKSTK